MGKDQIAVTLTMVVMIVPMLIIIAVAESGPEYQSKISTNLLSTRKNAENLWDEWHSIKNSPDKYFEFKEKVKAQLIEPCQEILEILEKEEANHKAGFFRNTSK